VTWDKVAAAIAEEFNLPPIKRTAFYQFLDWWRPNYVARRVQERALARDALREQRAKLGDMSPELAESLEQQAEIFLAKGDMESAQAVFNMAAKVREDLRKRIELQLRQQAEDRAKQDVEIKLRRLEMMERKLAEAGEKGETIDPAKLADEIDRTLGRKAG
jgi:hypothetical protein